MNTRRQAVTGLALSVLAGAFLIHGLTSPSIEFNRFYFLTDRHSILSVIQGLWNEGETFLGGILALFSVAFPALKITALTAAGITTALSGRMANRILRLSVLLGRWSMLDVLVLALVIFYVKNSGIGDANTLPGIWFFAASVILTLLAAFILTEKE
ncbi:MAG: paraquat-inducible protein A [Rhizobiales bacterium]|nr:paraquat-inducible protein A [Hyphomicrobiales bacterium]